MEEIFEKDFILLLPNYYKGIIYLLSLLNLKTLSENLKSIKKFCEGRDYEVRMKALHDFLINSFNRMTIISGKKIFIEENKKHIEKFQCTIIIPLF